jgi:hypothetical protein
VYCRSLFSGKAAIMSSGSPPTQFYERRKKSRRDVNTGEGGSRNPPPQRTSKRTVLRDFPRGRMHIDTEIEEVEEDPMETSDDESADDETCKMSPIPPSENSSEDDVESIESELRRQVEKEEQEEMVEGTLNPRSRGRVPFNHSPTIRRLYKPLSYHVTSYKVNGTTKQVKRLRKIDPRSQQINASNYRFHTQFQQDLYGTVIMERRRIMSEAQWVDWHHLEDQQDTIYNQVIAACESHHIKKLMGVHYDWNIEVIAQFYATLFIEEAEDVNAMHWMTKGKWYHITFDEFATRFPYGQVDKDSFRIHIHNPLEENEIKFMYAPGQEGNAGTINGLYTFYSVLNRLFRKTICPRDGDPTNISHYDKNLLANLRDGAPPFSVIDYIWEEIKGISLNPQKNCGFAPYFMFLIEDVMGRSFPKEGIHMLFRPPILQTTLDTSSSGLLPSKSRSNTSAVA